MIQLTNCKDVVSIFPQARVNNAAYTVTSADRKGFDYAVLDVTIGATDVALTVFKLQESDDNTNWTDITGADYTVSSTPPSSSSGNTVWAWDVDLRARKRYLRPQITVGNGSLGAFLTAKFKLFRAEQAPSTLATRNIAGVLAV